jgi:two-component system, LytTR family, sensor kinase
VKRFLKKYIDHIVFWVLTIFFHGYTRSSLIDQVGTGSFLIELIVRNGLLAIAVYSVLLGALPKLTGGKNVGGGVLIVIGAIVFYMLGKNGHDVYLHSYTLSDETKVGFFQYSLYNVSIVTFYLAFSSALYLSKQWYLQRQLIQKIEMEKLNTELEYLRAQINPHFLFNSLNTVYFQIDKHNQTARETLGKFSDMLRYQLYDCNRAEIDIEKEMAYLSNYVALQRLRMNENYSIQLTVMENVSGFAIPPLLLLPLVENAFKHVSHFVDKQNEISITLSHHTRELQLIAVNTIESAPSTSQEAGGIGLKNVTRRLELLYGERFLLSNRKEDGRYKVILKIPTE